MYCPKCYRMLPDDSTHCPNCGNNLDNPTCLKCGKQITPGDKACRLCGASVSGYREPPKRTVDWVWGDSTYGADEDEPIPGQCPPEGSWKDFCNDMSDFFQQAKSNWKVFRQNAKQSYQDFQEKYSTTAEFECICPVCGSNDVNFQTVSESKPVGCFGWLILCVISLFLSIFAFIFIVIIFALTRQSTKATTYATCQRCGKHWKV